MFRYMLAPLEDYSASAFRTLCYMHGADITFTEMTRVEGTVRNNKATLRKLECKDNTPVEIQLLASNEPQLEKYISSFKPHDGFKGFNLNMGCPSIELIKAGRGAGMVKRLSKAQRLVQIIKKHNYPVSVKLRLGGNELEKGYKVYLRLIENVDADYFIVHPKHGLQASDEHEDMSAYPECIDTGKEIIANGSINTKEKVDALKKMGIKGVMIGRGAVSNPAIFDLLKGNKIPPIEEIDKEYKDLCEKYKENEKYFSNYMKWKARGKEKFSKINQQDKDM